LNSETKTKRLYTVICKCITYENIIKKSSEFYDDNIPDFSDIDSIIKSWAEKKSQNNSLENSILEIQENKNKEKSILFTKNKSFIIPEYILEYNYSLNSMSLNFVNMNKSENFKNLKTPKIITSSYVTKESFAFLHREEFINSFNNSLKNLTNCEIKKHLSKEIIENYSSCKPQFFSELNSSELFFSKNSILNFLYMSHRYTNPESFSEEFNKILDKLEEIKNLNFKNPLITMNMNSNNNNANSISNLNPLFNNENTNIKREKEKEKEKENNLDLNPKNNLDDNNNHKENKNNNLKISNFIIIKNKNKNKN
jgi:hypothetical protein